MYKLVHPPLTLSPTISLYGMKLLALVADKEGVFNVR